LYIYGANHGQFNTSWGRADLSVKIYAPFLNLAQLMRPEAQQQAAKVYLSAFLEAALHQEREYLPLFLNARTVPTWLPNTIYLNRFDDSTTRYVATYEEDVDLSTTTMTGGVLKGDRLLVWREKAVPSKPGWGTQDTFAAYLSWDSPAAVYSLTLPKDGLDLTADSILTFAMADAAGSSQPIDLAIEGIDANGRLARLLLSTDSYLQPRLLVNVYKTVLMPSQPAFEPILKTFELKLSAFQTYSPAFDPASLSEIRFVFDLTPSGTIYLDDIGFK